MAALTPRAPIVGRDAELTRIADARAAVEAGRRRLVIVTGESGIGKSCLVAEAMAGARASGWRFLSGSCLDIGDGGLPYLPFAEAIRGMVRTTPADELERLLGNARQELAVISPELGALGDATASEGSPAVVPVPSGLSQARLFERILELLNRLAAAEPTALIVEDVHWIDRATRDLLTFLVRNLTTERVLVLLTCRTDGLVRGHPILAWLAELGREPSAVRIDLVRLPRPDVVRQLEAIGGEVPSPELVDRIWRRSEGNPMFVEELFAAGRAGRADERPGSLVEILLGRVAGLSRDVRTTIAALAVAGRPADERLLAQILAVEPDAVMAGLRSAIERGVVTLDPADGRHRFRHELLREVVEGELMAGERRGLHERFATVLAKHPDLAAPTPAGAAAELAHHWIEAGRTFEAYTASLAAGSAAEAVYAHVDAHRHFERAIELEGQLEPDRRPPADEVLALRRRAADAADFAGDLDRAIELTREALELVDPVADPETAGILHGRLGYVLWASGNGEASLDEHRAAVNLVPRDPPTAARARVVAGYAGALMGGARWADARDAAHEAAMCALAVDAPAEESRARNVLGSVLVALGDIDGGVLELRHARELAAHVGSPDALIVTHHNLALNLLQGDRFGEALIEARDGLEVARRTGLERRFGMDLAALVGEILLRLGGWEEASVTTRDAVALDPAGVGTLYLATVRARVAALRGDPVDALRQIAPFEVPTLEPDVAAEVSFARAEAALLAGQAEAASLAVDEGLRAMEGLDDVLWTVPLLGLGMRAVADIAERARAIRNDAQLGKARERAGRLGDALASVRERSVTATASAWISEAAASAARVEGIADIEAWQAAAVAWESVPDVYRAAEARYREAEAVLIRDGTRGAAAAALRTAHATAVGLGARPLADAVTSLAARARIALGLRVEAGPAGVGPVGVMESGATTTGMGPPGATQSGATQCGATQSGATDAGSGAARPGASSPDAGASLRAALGLSPREMEVLALVAAGLSNGEIAARLFITRKTAAVHVTHILDKLGVGNRVEAAVMAERAGLRT